MMKDILLIHRKSNKNFPEWFGEVAVWKTCLRQVIFCTESELKNISNRSSCLLESSDEILRGDIALAFLLEVLCGLRSPIFGETEVLGQFRNFIDTRKRQNDPLFADHQKWLHFIIFEVKRIRAEHLHSFGSQTYGSLLSRYTKSFDTITLFGSGQLASEIIPWLSDKKMVQILCRNTKKLSVKLPNICEINHRVMVQLYQNAFIQGDVLVIAAPVSDEMILQILDRQEARPCAIYDLRGEDNLLALTIQQRFPHIKFMGLQKFFTEMEENKKEIEIKRHIISGLIKEKTQEFMQRCELRPLGWDDLCA